MSESSLVSYTNISGNRTAAPDKKVLYIIPHVYVGQITTKKGTDHFTTKCNASCQYVIGTDGTVGLSVPELGWRAWTTGGNKTVKNQYGKFTGRDMDFVSVTIEMASDATAPYKINDKVRTTMVKLLADIAKRNNMGELKFKNDSSLVGNPSEQNILLHRWFASKSCPGDYVVSILPEVVKEANIINGYVPAPEPTPVPKVVPVLAKYTLRQGNTGTQVKYLQQDLNYVMGCNLAIDGIFGTCTKSALVSFQKKVFPDQLLHWDGVYGHKSYSKMKECLK